MIDAALREAQSRLAAAQRSGRRADLDQALAAAGRALTLARQQHPRSEGAALLAFAKASLLLGTQTGARRPIEEAALAGRAMNDFAAAAGDTDMHAAAAEVLRLAVLRLPPDHPDRAGLAAIRGSALVQWMTATGDPGPLSEAAEELDRAVRLCRPGDANLLPFLALRNDVHRLRFEHEATLANLDAFLAGSRAVLDGYPAGHPVVESSLSNLGQLYLDRFELAGDPADLDHAAHFLRRADGRARDPEIKQIVHTALARLAALRGPAAETVLPPGLTFVAGPGSTPQRPPERAGDDTAELARHMAVLTERLTDYERGGDPALLDRVCADGRRLLAGLPADHPQRWLIAVPLGPALMRRFETRGDAADLDQAVELLRVAVARPVLHPDHLTGDLINLAAALINRFLRDRGSADLDEAITCARRAVESAEPDDPARGRYLNTLGTALLYRFQHTGRRFDLDDAIETGEAALAAADTPDAVAHARANLGNRLRQRFHLGHDPADLDEAVRHLRAAGESGDQSTTLTLALVLADRGAGQKDRNDLLAAVEHYRSVLAKTAESSPLQGPARLGLAEALDALGRTGEAAAVLDGPAGRLPGQPFERMDALVLLARLLTRQGDGDWAGAAGAYARAVAQLPVTVWRGLPAEDRDELLARWWDVACDAAATAVAAGAAERAVELLDHGRSIWWSQVLDTRIDHAALAAADPELAARLTEAAARLADQDSDADERLRRVRDWERTVRVVRARPGFQHFLAPTPFAELAGAAADGPVVLVNVSRYRCDALVLVAGRVQVVPLPGLTAAQADDHTRRYLAAVAGTGVGGDSAGPREQVLMSYLEWLWDVVAEPVLDAVAVPAGSRLWWCPTGPLALAPLHAAGYHDPDDTPAGRTVLDRVVSSTTPTLRALRHARRPAPAAGPELLVVAYADPPGYLSGLPALPSAAREAEQLRARFPAATVVTGEMAARGRVRYLLGEHDCVHFACHGDAGGSVGRPALFLADAPLTTTDLARLDLPDAQLAVLTACHTAMGGTHLPDEAGHLAAALQVVGFRHVVSALWAIGDDTAAEVADQLYRQLTGPSGELRPARSAAALHAVVRELRDRDPYQPSRWAPFVHFGS